MTNAYGLVAHKELTQFSTVASQTTTCSKYLYLGKDFRNSLAETAAFLCSMPWHQDYAARPSTSPRVSVVI
ncbi:hypothetical protein SAMN04488512_1122 [Sulfitobacter litoralis]|uniref:Uncharacterized protein n=1 Tax=Sulfitobacter litoralis TaxID=335975 RepID=A0ABY0SHN7_9RHOB|nr:hypothetical protein SAMN04488512_1122 [Sulfitobacter litoralis]